MASFRLVRDSSIVFAWLAMSRSGHHATYSEVLLSRQCLRSPTLQPCDFEMGGVFGLLWF